MGTVTKPYDFNPHAAGAKIDSAQADANFDTLYTLVNGNIDADNLADGTVTTTKIVDANVTAAKLAAFPAARVYKDANTNMPGGDVTLSFNQERFDTDAIHDLVTNPSRLTCKTAGLYLITANVQFQAVAATYTVTIKLNGTTAIAQSIDTVSTTTRAISLSALYKLAVSDYVELVVNSGAASSALYVAGVSPEFSMVRLGA